MSITSVKFSRFKSLQQFTLQLRAMNILVGPNNAGKSSVLDGFRILAGAYRHARRVSPTLVRYDDEEEPVWGWTIPESFLPPNFVNIHTNYEDKPATITFRFKGGNELALYFRPQHSPLLLPKSTAQIRTSSQFRAAFPLKIAVVPTLGPFEREENLVSEDHLNSWRASHTASRLFRNLWYREPELFPAFAEMVSTTWPQVTIAPPEKSSSESLRLTMFCRERRIDREIAWAGFGFQIWLQLLTHIVRSQNADILVVDEPEIYLHPDLHRKILHILRERGGTTLLATHSVEILNEADPDEVALMEPGRQTARRLADIEGIQSAVSSLGSTQNLVLSRVARASRILFVEGNDRDLLSRFADKLSLPAISEGRITVVPIGGFSEHSRVGHAQWAFRQVLGQDISVAVLLDRDYRTPTEVEQVLAELRKDAKCVHILTKKEIENYLLVPRAVQAAIDSRLEVRRQRESGTSISAVNAALLLQEACAAFKDDTSAQCLARSLSSKASRLDASSVIKEAIAAFEATWSNPTGQLSIAPGKRVLSELNRLLLERHQISITNKLILQFMRADEIETDISSFLREVCGDSPIGGEQRASGASS